MMLSLPTIISIIYYSCSNCNALNTTTFDNNEYNHTSTDINTTDVYYSTTLYPTKAPTFMPTINGEFPYIHYAQSYIECGRNIELKDAKYSNAYAGFVISEIMAASILFIVCKASSTFHYWDELHLWRNDDDNTTEWNFTSFSPSLSSVDCTSFKPMIDILYESTYFIGLVRYKGDDYGTYTIYMECDTDYNQYIDTVDVLAPHHSLYNEYIAAPHFEVSDIIGSISCGIIILADHISRADWFDAPNREHSYSFTVHKYTEWIQISTCDATNKPHVLTLYYSYAADEWKTISLDVTQTDCGYLYRNYLIPGIYYITIDITNLLYNDYTIGMSCSANDSITIITDYQKYSAPSLQPTSAPIQQIFTSADNDNDSIRSTQSWIWIISFIVIISGLCIGSYLGYIKYRNRYKYKQKELKDKLHNNKRKASELEMAETRDGDVDGRTDDDSVSLTSLSSSHDSDSSEQKQDIVAGEAAEGEIAGEEGADDEGDVFIQRDIEDHEDGNDDIAPAAFANVDYEAVPVMMEGVDAKMGGFDEEILPDEQYEMQIGSYCFVDCNTVYGVIVDELKYDYFLIIDLFEKRMRKAQKKTLSLIEDARILQKAKKQYERYQRRERKRSRSQKTCS